MTTNSLSPEEIEQNFNKYRSLCEKKLGDRKVQSLELIDAFGERLAMCPASGKKGYHGAFPGGLIDHSLRVLNNAVTIRKSFDWNISNESLVLCCLFHDIGKAGLVLPSGEIVDYYIPAEQWRRDKLGELYTYNTEMPYMTTQHRTLHTLQHFNVKLTHEEFVAILLNDGFVVDENKPYCLKLPKLAHVVMTADYVSTMEEKNVSYWNT